MLSSRQFIQLCMFAVIYYLLALHADRGRLPRYEIFTVTIEENTKNLLSEAKRIQEAYIDESESPGQKERYAPFVKKMNEVESRSAILHRYIGQIKKTIDSSALLTPRKRLSGLKASFNHDTLLGKLNKHHEAILKIVPQTDRSTLSNFRPHWIEKPHLKDISFVGEYKAILAVYEYDLAVMEKNMIRILSLAGSSMIHRHNNIQAIAYPVKGFVLPGEKVKANMFLAAYNRALNPTITNNKGSLKKVENGVGTWERKNSPLGVHNIHGTASVQIDTITKTQPYSFSYMVVAPGISLQLDKATRCYVGVKNPITISVPGYTSDKLLLKVAGAKVTKTGGSHFNIFFNKLPKEKTYAFVAATNKDGETSTVASLPLIVQHLPAPIARVAGVNSGYISIRALRKAEGVSASLEESDFEMDYTVISYKLSLFHKRNSVYIEPVDGKGPYFGNSPAVMKILDIARRGDKVIFEDIIAEDDNGRKIELAPIILKLD